MPDKRGTDNRGSTVPLNKKFFMVYWYFSLVGKRRDIVPVIKRLLAPRLIIERVICRIHGKTHRAYFHGTKCYICRAASQYKLILKKNFVGYAVQR